MSKIEEKTKYSIKRSLAGFGLFAKTDFKKGCFIIEYTGEKILTTVADNRNSKYLFTLNSRWTIDGADRENTSRYINHSCRPNCEAVNNGKHIKIYAKRNIKPGEELTYNYGKEYFDEYIKPYGCRCLKCKK